MTDNSALVNAMFTLLTNLKKWMQTCKNKPKT